MMALRRIAVALEAIRANHLNRSSNLEWRRAELENARESKKAMVRIADALELQNNGVIRGTIAMLESWGEKNAAGVLWRAYRHQPGREYPHPADREETAAAVAKEKATANALSMEDAYDKAFAPGPKSLYRHVVLPVMELGTWSFIIDVLRKHEKKQGFASPAGIHCTRIADAMEKCLVGTCPADREGI